MGYDDAVTTWTQRRELEAERWLAEHLRALADLRDADLSDPEVVRHAGRRAREAARLADRLAVLRGDEADVYATVATFRAELAALPSG